MFKKQVTNQVPRKMIHSGSGETKLLFWVWRSLLIFPVVFKNHSVAGWPLEASYSRPLHVSSLFCLVGLLVLSWISIKDTTFRVDPLTSKSSTEVIVNVSDYFSLTSTAMMVGVVSSLQCKKVLRAVASLKTVDGFLGVDPGYLPFGRLFFPLIIFAVALVVFRFTPLIGSSSPIRLSVEILILLMMAAATEYSSLVLNIRHRFCLVNGKFRRALNAYCMNARRTITSLSPTPDIRGSAAEIPIMILELSSIHWELCEGIQNANHVFGYQLIGLMLFLLTQIIVTLYYLYILLSKPVPDYSGLGLQTGYFCLFTWVLTLIIWSCSTTTNEANQTSALLYRHLNCSKGNMKSEVLLFIQRFSHHNAEFNAFGLFAIGSSTATSVVSAVIMYWAILTQFQTNIIDASQITLNDCSKHNITNENTTDLG